YHVPCPGRGAYLHGESGNAEPLSRALRRDKDGHLADETYCVIRTLGSGDADSRPLSSHNPVNGHDRAVGSQCEITDIALRALCTLCLCRYARKVRDVACPGGSSACTRDM